jgi:hypothetical protein
MEIGRVKGTRAKSRLTAIDPTQFMQNTYEHTRFDVFPCFLTAGHQMDVFGLTGRCVLMENDRVEGVVA